MRSVNCRQDSRSLPGRRLNLHRPALMREQFPRPEEAEARVAALKNGEIEPLGIVGDLETEDWPVECQINGGRSRARVTFDVVDRLFGDPEHRSGHWNPYGKWFPIHSEVASDQSPLDGSMVQRIQRRRQAKLTLPGGR